MSEPIETPEATRRFSDAYRALMTGAKRIEQAPDEDLDTIVAIVREAREAKAVCEQRLAAAEKDLAELLGPASDGQSPDRDSP